MKDLLVYGSLISTVLLVATYVIFIHPLKGKSVKLFLAFSGAYLLGISFTHLLPEVYQHGSAIRVGIFVLVGFIFQLLLEFFSEGIEHAHVHIHSHSKKFPLTMMLSLSIHAFVEGIPLEHEIHETTFHAHEHSNHSLLLGIIFHNIPVTIALATFFIHSGFSKKISFFYIAIFSIMGPLGAFLSHQLGGSITENFAGFFEATLAIVVGMFLHISTTILFESSEGHRFNALKMFAILTGIALAIISI